MTTNYIYLGHGYDITDKHKLVRKIVPKDCVYINAAESGDTTQLRTYMNLVTIAKENPEFLDDPTKYKVDFSLKTIGFKNGSFNMNERGELYHDIKSGIRIHKSLHSYVNNRCVFWFPLTGPVVMKVGLYESTYNFDKYFDKELYKNVRDDVKPIPSFEISENGFTIQNIKDIFDGSKFPVLEEILDLLYENSRPPPTFLSRARNSITRSFRRSKLSKNTFLSSGVFIPLQTLREIIMTLSFTKTVENLMETFPGNHYNFTCRSVKQFVYNMGVEREKSFSNINGNGNNTVFTLDLVRLFCKNKNHDYYLSGICEGGHNAVLTHIIDLYDKLIKLYEDNTSKLNINLLEQDLCIYFIKHLNENKIKIPKKLKDVQNNFMESIVKRYYNDFIKRFKLKAEKNQIGHMLLYMRVYMRKKTLKNSNNAANANAANAATAATIEKLYNLTLVIP